MINLLTKTETAPTAPRRTVAPRYNVLETADAFTLTAWLPGTDRSSLEVMVNDETLTVIGHRAFTAPAEWTPVHREIPPADYRLEIELGRRVNREALKAELTHGVLTLTLPKAEAVKPRQIEIKG